MSLFRLEPHRTLGASQIKSAKDPRVIRVGVLAILIAILCVFGGLPSGLPTASPSQVAPVGAPPVAYTIPPGSASNDYAEPSNASLNITSILSGRPEGAVFDPINGYVYMSSIPAETTFR